MSTKSLPLKRFSVASSFNRNNLAKVPSNQPGVYRIKNAKNKILYVGIARGGRLAEKIAEHKGELAGGTKFQYRIARNRLEAERIESEEIKNLKPAFNKKN